MHGNPKPKTLNPKTQNPKPKTLNPKPRIRAGAGKGVRCAILDWQKRHTLTHHVFFLGSL